MGPFDPVNRKAMQSATSPVSAATPASMAGGDCGLQSISAQGTTQFSARSSSEPTTDQQPISACTVLIEQQNGLTRGTGRERKPAETWSS